MAEFVIQLKRGHTGCRARNLEVHVTQMVFISENIGQDN